MLISAHLILVIQLHDTVEIVRPSVQYADIKFGFVIYKYWLMFPQFGELFEGFSEVIRVTTDLIW